MQETIIVDASAIGHLFLRADGCEVFEDAFETNAILVSSDLIFYEFGNIMSKYIQFAKLEEHKAVSGLNWLREMISHSFNLSHFSPQILELSITTSLSFYDASYLFLAKQQNVRLASNDKKLVKVARENQVEVISRF